MRCLWVLLALVPVVCHGHVLQFESEAPEEKEYPDFGLLSDKEIDYINSLNTTWKAGRNFDKSWAKHFRGLLGAIPGAPEGMEMGPGKLNDINKPGFTLPETFDARTRWPHCRSVHEIRDQGACGASWVMAGVAAMSDRICIHSKGVHQTRISADNLLGCCGLYCGHGCHGGIPYAAWGYWHYHGIVSGGPYGSTSGCQPFRIKPCSHYQPGHDSPCSKKEPKTPWCLSICTGDTNKTYTQDLHFGGFFYHLVPTAVNLQHDLYDNGPFGTMIQVYTDFLHYKSGVYSHVSGGPLWLHAVKLMGWGVENGTAYWLVANSWNTDWGDDGFFKIRRNVNECQVEAHGMGGFPKY